MKIFSRLFLPFVVCVTGPICETHAADAGVSRIIFIAGKPSHGHGEHEYRAGSMLLARVLNEQSGLPVKAEVVSGWPEDESVLQGAAEIVFYDSGTQSIGKNWEKLDALAKAGKGLTFLHYAVHPSASMGEQYYRPWMGGAFESGFSVNPFWVADLKPLPEHPVSYGISLPVRAYDEFYYNIRFREDHDGVLDLVSAAPTSENIIRVNNLWTQEGLEGVGKPQTLMWGVERPDGGRGVGFSGGHFHRNWAIDDYRRMVLNAIVWCAGMDVPEGGVVSKPLTEDDINANLDEKRNAAERLTLPSPEELAQLKPMPVPTVKEHEEIMKQRKSGKTQKLGENTQKPEGSANMSPAKSEDRKAEGKSKKKKTEGGVKNDESLVKPQREMDGEPGEVRYVETSAFKVPDNLEVTLWAKSPLLFNPTNMDTDRDGRIWVAEGVDYRKVAKRRPEGDRIVVIEDSDHDGKADQSHVFVQDPELVSPLGISVFGNKIVVAQPPNLIVYTDVDGDRHFDPKVDKRENLLSGFQGFNHDHSLHSVVSGPDGRWYFNHGNTGAKFTTRDGVTYQVGGPYQDAENYAGAKSDDGRIWTGGFAASMNPDGTKLRMIGHGFRNSYEHCVTSFGDVFQNDNDDPPACRTTWLMEGGYLGFFSRNGKRTWKADRRRGQSIPTAHWRQEDPGTLPPGDVYGSGAPTGIAYYENGALPTQYQGLLISAESRRQKLYGYYPKTEGAGKTLERFDFLDGSSHVNFRPSDVMVGADGAIYMADWYDKGVGGHGTSDGTWSGAIYRIAPKGFQPSIAKPETTKEGALTANGALTLLQSPAVNVRFEGLNSLKEFALKDPAGTAKILEPMLEDSDPFLRARAVWLLPFLGEAGLTRCLKMLGSKTAEERILALRVLRNSGFDLVKNHEVLENAVIDEDASVRREAAVFLRELPADFRTPLAVELFVRCDGRDRTYLEACGLAAEGIEAKVWSIVKGRMNQNGPLMWSEAFARITWRLQPAAAIPELVQRASSSELPLDERKLAIDTIAFTRTQSAIDAMRTLRHGDPAIAELASAWLLNRATDEWEEFGGRQVLKDEGLYDPEHVVVQEIKMPDLPAKQAPMNLGEVMRLQGNAANGKNVAARCTMCHRIGDAGVDYGPDLAGWVSNQGGEAFLKSVINPSERIALGFEGQIVPLKDGRQVQGIVISAGDPITVRSTGGITQMIPHEMLDKRMEPLRRSLMLSAQELGLTQQELADLAAFMKDYK